MNDLQFNDETLDVERYELYAEPVYSFLVTRRHFFKVLGGGVAVFFLLQDVHGQESGGDGRAARLGDDILGAWLHIGETGKITVYTGKVEVGQNIRTSLSQVVAEELRVPIVSIHMVMGDTDLVPYDRGTFGSRSTPVMGPQLRKVAAAAREMLLDLAAQEWQVDRSVLMVKNGQVLGAGKQADFGQLARGKKWVQTVREDAPVTPVAHWQVAGTSLPKVNGRDIVTGKHPYTSDMHVSGMLYGKMLRPPAFEAKLVSVDVSAAIAMKGVTVVHDGDFVGVAAPDELLAMRALEAIKANWQRVPQPSRKDLFVYLKEQAGDVRNIHKAGDVAQALQQADYTLQTTYAVDYIAHAPLEPRAALAQWLEGALTVWTGTQRPFGVRDELVKAFGIAEDRVRVIMPDMGSGYGGKHTGEAAIEAARLARSAGQPVKVVWTREEEFTWAYFRPAGLIEVNSGVLKDGTVVAWDFHNYNSGAAAIQPMYAFPNQSIAFHPSRSPLRQGSYRGLAATANHFARETQMDEMARLVGIDALSFRRQNITDDRLRAVFEAAALHFGWGKTKPAPDHGFGIAGGFDKGGYVATCAEVAVDRQTGKVSVIRVVAAFECGAIINPDQLKNQIEGSLVQGLGGALFEAVDFADGKILNPFFGRYRVPRFADIPKIDVVLLDRKDLPSAGAGEAPIVGIAPAIGNAIFDATGVRLRTLPLVPDEIKIG